MEFEKPELAETLRELAIERDASFADRRMTYVDYDATGAIERINWPEELGPMPSQAAIDQRLQVVKQRVMTRQARMLPILERLRPGGQRNGSGA